MADEKVVVGWAIRASCGTMWIGPNARLNPPWDWQEKPQRRIFPTRDEAFKEFYSNGMARDREAAVVRITRKVKQKQYFVQMGPFSPYVADLCVEQLSQNLSSHFLPKIVEKDLSK